MRFSFPLIVVIAATISVAGCATSVMTSGRVVVQDEHASISIGFSNRDREIIRNYYARSYKKKHKKSPPGLAKQGKGLPPGLAKRDVLPRGLRERNLPADLEHRLSRLPTGYVRVIVGSDVVVMKTRTRVIIDIYRSIYSN